MWIYEKKLQYPVNIQKPDPAMAKLIIAQRVASVEDADLILVMDNGRIVDQGSHAQLLR